MSYADNPIRRIEDEWLDRKSSVEALLQVIAAAELETPLVVGVYGAWGSGKTSVMRLLLDGLRGDQEMPSRVGNRHGADAVALWFDAWKYARQDMALWRALLLAVVEALGDEEQGLPRLIRQSPVDAEEIRARVAAGDEAVDAGVIRSERIEALRKELEELSVSLYRSQTITEPGDVRVNWKAAVPFAADLALRVATLGLSDKLNLSELVGKLTGQDPKAAMTLLEREEATRYRERVTSLEQFHKELRKLVAKHIVEPGRRLYLFIDDLDRCLPEDAVGALEAIKLFLDLPGCVFVLGMDRHVVEQGIRVRYKDFALAGGLIGPVDPRQYLDKIIQVPFRLPPLSERQMAEFVKRWCVHYKNSLLEEFATLISTGVAPNPRSVKRTLNMLRLMLMLDSRRDRTTGGLMALGGHAAARSSLGKIVVLQTSYDDLYHEVVKRPAVLQDIENQARDRRSGASTKDWFAREGGERLKAMFALPPHFEGLNDDQLRALVFVTEITA